MTSGAAARIAEHGQIANCFVWLRDNLVNREKAVRNVLDDWAIARCVREFRLILSCLSCCDLGVLDLQLVLADAPKLFGVRLAAAILTGSGPSDVAEAREKLASVATAHARGLDDALTGILAGGFGGHSI